MTASAAACSFGTGQADVAQSHVGLVGDGPEQAPGAAEAPKDEGDHQRAAGDAQRELGIARWDRDHAHEQPEGEPHGNGEVVELGDLLIPSRRRTARRPRRGERV
jgi:hypothetical protein